MGIDVSKARLDTSLSDGKTASFADDEAGIAALVERFKALSPALIVLEATGGYEYSVTAGLAAARLPVAVVNPRQVRDFAKATGQSIVQAGVAPKSSTQQACRVGGLNQAISLGPFS